MTENTSPQVSGRAFLGLIKYLKGWGSQKRLEEIVVGAGASARAVFTERIRITGWYPYEAFTGFLVSIDRKLGKGDTMYCRQLGVIAGQRDMGTIFKIYVSMASADRLISSCSKLWLSYFRNGGVMKAVEAKPERTVLRVEGFATMHPAHCRLTEGWIAATMDSGGFHVLSVDETECMSRGGPYHEFTFRWQRKPK